MENQVKFDADALGFYPKPKFEVVLRDGRFKLLDLPGNQEVDWIAAGVYAWVHVSANGCRGEVRYIGLFGQRAKLPSFRRRMHQHLRGLTSSLAGKAPTKHWEHVLVPSLLIDLEGGGSVQMYLRHAETHEVNDLETGLIAQFSPPWNAAKIRGKTAVPAVQAAHGVDLRASA